MCGPVQTGWKLNEHLKRAYLLMLWALCEPKVAHQGSWTNQVASLCYTLCVRVWMNGPSHIDGHHTIVTNVLSLCCHGKHAPQSKKDGCAHVWLPTEAYFGKFCHLVCAACVM